MTYPEDIATKARQIAVMISALFPLRDPSDASLRQRERAVNAASVLIAKELLQEREIRP